MDLQDWLGRAVSAVQDWEASFPPFGRHPSLEISDERFAAAFEDFARRLRGNYPYFHPFYAGQMLKPPHPAAVAGYLAAMLINPNNHALDGGPVTSAMEKEAVAQLAAMFGLRTHLGHLTSSGTIANLEALYVARELRPGLGVAYSAEAHYTHSRMCGLLGIPGTAVEVDEAGRLDPGALDALLAGGNIGTVVATAGRPGSAPSTRCTRCSRWPAGTGRGSTSMRPTAGSSRCWRARAARPGSTRLRGGPSPSATRSWSTRTSTGCSRTAAGRSCSAIPRSGASTRTTRPTPTSPPTSCTWARSAWSAPGRGRGGRALAHVPAAAAPGRRARAGAGAGRRAALAWSELLAASGRLRLYQRPELDIVCYFPVTSPAGQRPGGREPREHAHGPRTCEPVGIGVPATWPCRLNVTFRDQERRAVLPCDHQGRDGDDCEQPGRCPPARVAGCSGCGGGRCPGRTVASASAGARTLHRQTRHAHARSARPPACSSCSRR
jgi:hypothetical protein